MSKKDVVIGCVTVLLAGTAAAGLLGWRAESKRVQQLEGQLKVLQQQEKRSTVDRSISKQMEAIAFQQQAVSEDRRDEAIQQSLLAQEMTRRSEMERQNALKAQQAAETSEQEARAAYLLAENQRQIAEQQRLQAEYAKRVADTLNYISLARTLGTQSFTLYQAGNTEVGNLLAYVSLLFTQDYHGDVYMPSVFQALTQSSKGKRNYSVHQGAVSCVDYFSGQEKMLTVSTYGEIFTHEMRGRELVTRRVFHDSDYDFRNAYALKGKSKNTKCYAVSRTGHLVVVDGEKSTVVPLDNMLHPFRIVSYQDGTDELLIIGENSLTLFDANADRIVGERKLDFKVICTGRANHKPVLFDEHGMMYVVNSLDQIDSSKVPVPGTVTAFASSNNEHLSAYGTMDGTIWLVDDNSRMVRQLVGHLSRVTKLKFNGRRLYSSSYDGKLLFWMIGTDPMIRPVTLFQADSWLMDFTSDNKKNYLWTGDAQGNLTEYLISLDLIQERLKNNLTRDFTQDEWNYYIGKGIPFRGFKNNAQQ